MPEYGLPFHHPLPDNLLLCLQPGELFLVVDTHCSAHDKEMRRTDGRDFVCLKNRYMQETHPPLPGKFLKKTAGFVAHMLEDCYFPSLHSNPDPVDLISQ